MRGRYPPRCADATFVEWEVDEGIVSSGYPVISGRPMLAILTTYIVKQARYLASTPLGSVEYAVSVVGGDDQHHGVDAGLGWKMSGWDGGREGEQRMCQNSVFT